MSVNEKSAVAARDKHALEAYRILRFCFVVAPVLFGLDKFFNLLTQWPKFLAPLVANAVPVDAFMRVVGVVEIAAGLLVLVKPRVGAYVVAAWLLAIIGNLLLIPGYYDVALRDFGLMLGALALARLSSVFAR
jgi:uncharacterized membrane protein YphA (DoxX/SURF4 family)